jgi:predicted TIM-barrel fold metal-dependent hydrolase
MQRLPLRISQPPMRALSAAPRLQAPRGACDTHIHIVGPQRRFPVAATIGPFHDVIYEDSTVDDALAMLDACGLDRGIYVGSALYGHRYDPMVHALTRAPDRLRGVAILDPQSTDGELALLDAAGVVGIRLSRADGAALDMRLIGRVLEHDWTIECVNNDWSGWRAQLLSIQGRVVIEHLGHIDPDAGFDAPTFRFLLEALDTGRVWVKLSARTSRQHAPPFGDLLPYVQRLIAHAPERMLYGSDWPHLLFFDQPMVDDAALLDMMLEWAPDESVRNRILVDNAAAAYRWPV